ncbi:protein LIAT1 [Seriola dumerili]|uniref:protein LIAT1 n=1 Tax=Seriola dumerili TaxID=41447 RepID=UPI000BBE4184|nr:protein LIAT1 [Seriola dumerili]
MRQITRGRYMHQQLSSASARYTVPLSLLPPHVALPREGVSCCHGDASLGNTAKWGYGNACPGTNRKYQRFISTACQDYIMPENKSCTLLQQSRSTDKKKKKKKRKKATDSTTPAENTQKPQTVSLHPETSPVSLLTPQSPGQPQGQLPRLRTTSKKDGERLAGSFRRSKKHPKDSPAPLTATNKTSSCGAPAQGHLSELSTQARESLRWEGVLEDPQAEEKRLELYRASRRQRYNAHREALLKETLDALRQTFPKESTETESDQHENASLLHLSID